MTAEPKRIVITYDPTHTPTLRWDAIAYDVRGNQIKAFYCNHTRKSAERRVRRYFERLPGRKSYTYEVSATP